MADVRPRLPRRLTAGIALVAVGLVLWALYKLAEDREAHSYGGGEAPASVLLVSGHTYWLALPGGIGQLATYRVDPADLACNADYQSGQDAQLQTVDEQDGSNAVHQIASFVAPVGGRATVTCAGLPATADLYVDNVTGDPSGWLIVLGVIALSVGAPLLLSGVRTLTQLPPRPAL